MSNNTITTTSSPTLSFAGDADTGLWFSGDDNLTIAVGGGTKKPPENYKKIHVARRRQAKKLGRPMVWGITNASPTTLTVTQDP